QAPPNTDVCALSYATLVRSHHQEWQACVGGAAVEQARDIGMFQSCKEASLLAEASQHLGTAEPEPDHLERSMLLEVNVESMGLVYHAHPALVEHLVDLPTADTLPHQCVIELHAEHAGELA